MKKYSSGLLVRGKVRINRMTPNEIIITQAGQDDGAIIFAPHVATDICKAIMDEAMKKVKE